MEELIIGSGFVWLIHQVSLKKQRMPNDSLIPQPCADMLFVESIA